jgi:uncharacterized SAM-binding protein YcdF (DUF218 family)
LVSVPITGARHKRGRFSVIRRAIAAGAISTACYILVLSTPAGAGLLFRYLEIYPALEPSKLPELASGAPVAIVILSAGRREYAPEYAVGDRGTVDALSLERIRYGAWLARRTKIPVLVSGGLQPVPLAMLMADTLSQDYGITPHWIEARSANTAQNAIFSSAILKADGVHRVILVTHAWHMKRAMAAFEANGMTAIAAPTAFYLPEPEDFLSAVTPNLSTFRMSGYGMHELIGGIWYKLRYDY